MVAICCAASMTFAAQRDEADRPEKIRGQWRRTKLETMRVAVTEHLLSEPEDLDAYLAAGFNTLVVFDVNGCVESGTAWSFKSEEQIRAETAFARERGLPLIIGMAVEPYVGMGSETAEYSLAPFAARRPFAMATNSVVPNALIPQATDTEIRERLELWKKYGDDVVIGAFPWYDDVFRERVDVERQRHVYRLIKEVAPDWYGFGMIGEFGFNATDDEAARYYDPAAFDHLIVLMYPFNVGSAITGFPLDNIASSDPDGDMIRYVDHYLARMEERFFRHLQGGQLILLVGQAFYYPGDAKGHIPRANDIAIMMRRGNEQLRKVSGQQHNFSAAYYYWGAEGSFVVGLSQRSDWLAAVRDVGDGLERDAREELRP
jgi:hypothetical protein